MLASKNYDKNQENSSKKVQIDDENSPNNLDASKSAMIIIGRNSDENARSKPLKIKGNSSKEVKMEEDGNSSDNSDTSEGTLVLTKRNIADSDRDSRSKSPKSTRSENSLKRTRSKYQWVQHNFKPQLASANSSNKSKREKWFLQVSNLPTDWNAYEINNFILKEVGPVDIIHMAFDEENSFLGIIKLELEQFQDCYKVFKMLNRKIVEGVELHAETVDPEDDFMSDEEMSAKKKKDNNYVWRPDIDVWDEDPKGLYGLSRSFLDSLGITPPIDKWVLVSDFRCDKSELKEALELAGQVLVCSVDMKLTKIARVMYSHPLEAVQAVSMLNNQPFYGQKLKVSIERNPIGTAFLPKGLAAIGPGLGKSGIPLRNIVQQYERFAKNKDSFVNPAAFVHPDDLISSYHDEDEVYVPKTINGPLKSYLSSENGSNVFPSDSPSLSDQEKKVKICANFDTPISKTGPIPDNVEPSISTYRPESSHSDSLSAPGTVPVRTGPMRGPETTPGPRHSMPGPLTPNIPRHLLSPMVRPQGPMLGPQGPMPRHQGPMLGPQGPMPGPHGHMPGHLRPMSGPSGPMVRPQGPVSGPQGPFPGPQGPMPGPRGPTLGTRGPMPGAQGSMSVPQGPAMGPQVQPRQNWSGVGPMTQFNLPQMPPNIPSSSCNTDYTTVELTNLPLTTTFAILSEKMALCGQVLSLQLTSPGCAIVQFAQRAHAQKCFQDYNNLRIMNNVIAVKFL